MRHPSDKGPGTVRSSGGKTWGRRDIKLCVAGDRASHWDSVTEPLPPHRVHWPVPRQYAHTALGPPPVPPQSSHIFQPWQSGHAPSNGISSEIRINAPSAEATRLPSIVRRPSLARKDPPRKIFASEASGSSGVMIRDPSSSIGGNGPSTSFDTTSPRSEDRFSADSELARPVMRHASFSPSCNGSVPCLITTRAYRPRIESSAMGGPPIRGGGLETVRLHSHGWDDRTRETEASALTHLLLPLAAAHPLLAPLPAHLAALLPRTRGAFHPLSGCAENPGHLCSFR